MIGMVRFFVGTVVAALAAPVGAAERLQTPGALFGVRESVSHADLSPDGTQLVYIAAGPAGSSIAYVQSLSGGDPQPTTHSDGKPERLRWCNFVSNTRLVCRVSAIIPDAGVLIPFSRLYAIDTNGKNLKQLGQRSSSEDVGIRQFDGAIIDWLPGQEGSVLMSRSYVAQATTAASRISRSAEGLGVDRIDTSSLKASPVERPNKSAGGYITDGRGNVRMMAMVPDRGATEQAGNRVNYFYRVAGSKEWRPFSSVGPDGDGMIPLAVDATLDAAYVLKKLDGRYALYRVKLDGSNYPELVYSNKRVDVDDVVRASSGDRVIGVTYADERRHTVYFDPEYKALAASLAKAIPNLPLIGFGASSADGSKILIHAGSDSDPGRFYVYEKQARKLNEIMLVRPQLENVQLASVRPVTYPAADGTGIPGYLTLPPGKDGKNLPAVVLPHGGPSARDEWGFDWLAQYLANQGFAVLQPNYRGSAGFGDAWLKQNGFQGWRTSIGDISAGARWLASQGIADSAKLAIVGWSYGGYAALQAGATEPDLFKAIVAIAPVTDLALVKEQARDYTNARNVAEFIGSGPHIAEGSPLRNPGRIKAPVLLFHGDRDLNVGVAHTRRMHDALKAAGKQSDMTIYQGLEHSLEDSNARANMLDRIGAFLKQAVGQ